MIKNKWLDAVGVLLLFIGFALAFLPHAVHTSIGLDDNTSHVKHVAYGIILVIAALAILIYNNKSWNVKAFKLKR